MCKQLYRWRMGSKTLVYYDTVYYDTVAWMPIPSFDDILEANRDVLERIKEKGD